MKVLPSTSVRRAPLARLMKRGDAPTDLKARTGLSTPPGRILIADANNLAERFVFISRFAAKTPTARRSQNEDQKASCLSGNVCCALERACHFARIVADDHVGTGP